MKSRSLVFPALLALACLGVALGYLTRRSSELSPIEGTPPTIVPTAPALSAPAALAPSAQPVAPAGSPLLTGIEWLCDLLEKGTASSADLANLKASLLDADPAQAMAAIRTFLRTRRNAPTGKDFVIGPGGKLNAAPTLRLHLLDALGQIARRSRSDEAAQVAREILAEKSSADEWALSLRNVAWTDPRARPFLADKLREMLAFEPWRSKPSAGLIEALDVIVFAKDATFIPDLAELRTEKGELAHGADIALDRLADTAPLEVLVHLNTHPTLLNDRPFLRADYFAKADLSQPAQRAQIEIYLGRPDIAAAEKTKLLKALTTPASFIGDSLVSTPAPPDDGATRRAGLIQSTREWLDRNRFPALREPLLEIQQRIAP